MSKPAPRSNFMQTLLLALCLFLLMNLFFNRPNPTDIPPADKIMAKMRDLSAQASKPDKKLREQAQSSIQGELSTLERRIDEDARQGKLTEQKKEELRLEGQIVAADTLYKIGVLNQDTGPLTQAYFTLQGPSQQYAQKPVWVQHEFKLVPDERFSDPATTGDEVYARVVSELSRQNKEHLVLGLIPGYQLIDALVNLTNASPSFSYAFAALLLALLVRAMIWPLAQRQYMWGRQMARLQPLVAEIRERFKDKKTGQIKDLQGFQKKSMEVYKEYGFNPMAGCFPALIQVPYFLLIYNCMLQYRFEFHKGHFLWINPELGAATQGFIAPNLGERDYILIVLYAISMVVTTLLTPVSDPNNAKQQRMIGLLVTSVFSITMFFWPLPSAFVLYWVFTNIFATVQMLRAYRLQLPPLAKVNAPGGGVFPVEPTKSNGAVTGTGVPVKHRSKKKR